MVPLAMMTRPFFRAFFTWGMATTALAMSRLDSAGVRTRMPETWSAVFVICRAI